jgi:hypothetical protein
MARAVTADVDTIGITLPVEDWQRLFGLARKADRAPSDYLRTLIRHAAEGPVPVLPGGPAQVRHALQAA